MGSLTNSYSELVTAVNTLDLSLNSVENSITGIEEDIGDIQEALPETIVLYDKDSTDSNINLGYTSGALGRTTLTIDLSSYEKLSIYASLNGFSAQTTIYLKNRTLTDHVIFSAADNFTSLHFLKVNIPSSLDKVEVKNMGVYTYDSTTGNVSFQYSSRKAGYFIYRIEGMK